MTASQFTVVFMALIVLNVALRLWLDARQMRHVKAHRDSVPPQFAGRIPVAAHQKAADYTIARTRLSIIEDMIGTLITLALTLGGGLAILFGIATSLANHPILRDLALLVGYALVTGIASIPLGLYRTFVLEERFGFNKMTARLWLLDLLKSSLIGVLIGLPIAALILWMMGAAGSGWWLWAWGVWMGFNLLLLLVYPTFIAPFFNKFEPLKDEALRARVTALMQRCGFSAKGLFVMDGSKRSAHANAYFTGFGASKRVVFYDTLLSKLSADEVEAVLAHELGHFKHRHVIKRIVFLFALSLAGFALLGWLATQVWFYTGLGVQPNLAAPNDALAVLLFMLVLPVFSFFIGPLFAGFSRKHEFQADAYAVAHASGQNLASALLKLYEDNASTLTPDPVYVKFYYSHPPAAERLARMLA